MRIKQRILPSRKTWAAYGWWFLALYAGGLVLRLYHLGSQCFWFDEAQTLLIARLPWDEIVQRAYRPPLYHYLLHVWSAMVPDTEFWLRLPSALTGALIPPLTYLLGARIYGRRTGILAGLFAALSPALVAYAQELRMYSLLALEFALLCWFSARVLPARTTRVGPWVGYFGATVAALYTHYFTLPFLLAQGLAGLLLTVWWRRYDTLRRWILVHVLAGLAFIPWLVVVFSGRGGTEDYIEAEVSPILAEVPGVPAFLHRLWLFFTTGPTTSDAQIVRTSAIVAGSLFLLAVAYITGKVLVNLWNERRSRRLSKETTADLVMFLLLAIPVVFAAVMYSLRPGTVHPRHLMMLAVPFSLLVARVAGLLWGQRDQARRLVSRRALRVAAMLWTGGFLCLFVLSVVLYFTDPAMQRANIRELANEIEARTGRGDVVLLPYQDYAFDYYFQGPATSLYLETRVGDRDLLTWVLPQMQGAQRAVLLRWVHTLSDPRDALDWFLESNGRLEERFWSAERWASVYALHGDLDLPQLGAVNVSFGPVQLTGAWIPQDSPADEILAIALSWKLIEDTADDLKASMRLIDGGGNVVVADDRVILGERSPVGTSQWKPGGEAHNYYLLEIPAGTPPVDYRVTVTVYNELGPLPAREEAASMGMRVDLGSVTLMPGAVQDANLPTGESVTILDQELASGLLVAAIGPLPQSLEPAQPLDLTIYWRATRDLPPLEPAIVLVDADGNLLAETTGTPVYGQYATDRWAAGELVTDHRTLRTGPEAAPGLAKLYARLGDQRALLGELVITPSERNFAPPKPEQPVQATFDRWASLAGYRLDPAIVRAGGPLSVTLYWQALKESSGIDYTMFVQLLSPDDRVIAQHDGMPATGRWPTGTWVQGQTIEDRHALTFGDNTFTGEARVIAGLYDASTLIRVLTTDGADHVELGWVTIQ